MATVNVQAARERTIGSRGALGEAFKQVIQGLSHIQEAFLHQERRTEERLREMEQLIREVITHQEQRLQEERRSTETALAREAEARRVATSAFEAKLRRMETRVEALERLSSSSGVQQRAQASGVEGRLAQLERRMEHLEPSTQRALQSVLPRVDALLKGRSSLPRTISTAASTSASSAASSASASSPAPRPRSPSAGSAAPPPLTPERRKVLGEQLLEAAKRGKETDVRRLLDEGADVNYSDTNRQTPLLFASNSSHVNVVSLLIGMGADVNAMNGVSDTALHLATFHDSSGRCASQLLRAGALVDVTNDFGQTPLHLAAWAGNEAAARALLAAGASKGARADDGKTPTEYAITYSLRQLLRN